MRAEQQQNLGSGLKATAEPSCRVPTYIVYLFQIHPRWRFFINIFYLKSSHRLKSISGTIIIIVNNNNYDFIAILLLTGGPESHSRVNQDFS